MSLKVRWTLSIWEGPLYIPGRNAPKFWFTTLRNPGRTSMSEGKRWTFPTCFPVTGAEIRVASLGHIWVPSVFQPDGTSLLLLMRMTVLLSKPKATSTLFHLNCDKCRVVTSGALQDQAETWDQGEQGQQCRSSAAINKAEEWAQVNCPVLLLCWNIAKGTLIAHTFSMAFLGYSDTTLYR